MNHRALVPVLSCCLLLVAACTISTTTDGTRGANAGEPATADADAASGAAEPGAPTPPAELPPPRPGTAPENPYTAEQIARGATLVTSMDCGGCHTPFMFDEELGMPVPDMSRMLSGHPEGAPTPAGTLGPGDMAVVNATGTAWALPFGTVYTINLTPDVDTGTGSWTEQMFVDIFRTGRHLGGSGRPVFPPMPWLAYSSLPDEDLIAIFAYLRSIPPISNYVPEPEIPEEVMWGVDRANQAMIAQVSASAGGE